MGLSDHTMGVGASVAAVAHGATVVEKHFTLRRADGGVDSAFSLEPNEFRQMVDAIRTAESALGSVAYEVHTAERACTGFRRSLFVVRDVARGQVLTNDDVRSIRPGDGLAPQHLDSVIGRRAVSDLPRGTPLQWRHVA